MNPKKIVLCPNPNRDRGMEATRAADRILQEMGFRTVVCSPFRDPQEGAFAGYRLRPLAQEAAALIDAALHAQQAQAAVGRRQARRRAGPGVESAELPQRSPSAGGPLQGDLPALPAQPLSGAA